MESSLGNPELSAQLLQKHSPKFWSGEYRTYDYFRFGRLCAWLRRQGAPPQQVGYSILIWKLSFADLHAALYGPPPELGELPASWQTMMNLSSLDNLDAFQVVISSTANRAAGP